MGTLLFLAHGTPGWTVGYLRAGPVLIHLCDPCPKQEALHVASTDSRLGMNGVKNIQMNNF